MLKVFLMSLLLNLAHLVVPREIGCEEVFMGGGAISCRHEVPTGVVNDSEHHGEPFSNGITIGAFFMPLKILMSSSIALPKPRTMLR